MSGCKQKAHSARVCARERMFFCFFCFFCACVCFGRSMKGVGRGESSRTELLRAEVLKSTSGGC